MDHAGYGWNRVEAAIACTPVLVHPGHEAIEALVASAHGQQGSTSAVAAAPGWERWDGRSSGDRLATILPDPSDPRKLCLRGPDETPVRGPHLAIMELCQGEV